MSKTCNMSCISAAALRPRNRVGKFYHHNILWSIHFPLIWLHKSVIALKFNPMTIKIMQTNQLFINCEAMAVPLG